MDEEAVTCTGCLATQLQFAVQNFAVAIGIACQAILSPLDDVVGAWEVICGLALWVWTWSLPFFSAVGHRKRSWKRGGAPLPLLLLVIALAPAVWLPFAAILGMVAGLLAVQFLSIHLCAKAADRWTDILQHPVLGGADRSLGQ